MKILVSAISAATLVVASASASAWWGNDGFWGNDGWGDGYVDGGFSMSFSGHGRGRGYGRGYGYGYDYPYYGYGPYGVAPYGYGITAPAVDVVPAETTVQVPVQSSRAGRTT